MQSNLTKQFYGKTERSLYNRDTLVSSGCQQQTLAVVQKLQSALLAQLTACALAMVASTTGNDGAPVWQYICADFLVIISAL